MSAATATRQSDEHRTARIASVELEGFGEVTPQQAVDRINDFPRATLSAIVMGFGLGIQFEGKREFSGDNGDQKLRETIVAALQKNFPQVSPVQDAPQPRMDGNGRPKSADDEDECPDNAVVMPVTDLSTPEKVADAVNGLNKSAIQTLQDDLVKLLEKNEENRQASIETQTACMDSTWTAIGMLVEIYNQHLQDEASAFAEVARNFRPHASFRAGRSILHEARERQTELPNGRFMAIHAHAETSGDQRKRASV